MLKIDKFSFNSIIISESLEIYINDRPYFRFLMDKLKKENLLHYKTIQDFHNDSQEIYPNDDLLKEYYHGYMYCYLDVAMLIQNIGLNQLLPMFLTIEENIYLSVIFYVTIGGPDTNTC